MENLISANKLVKETISKNWENTNLSIKKLEKDSYDKTVILNDKIRNLQNEKYKLENELSSNKKLLNEAVNNYIEENKHITEKYKRVISLLGVYKTSAENDFYPKLGEISNRGKFVECIAQPIINDKYYNVGVFIYENDNRTNGYTLGVAFISYFNRDLFSGMKYDYGFKPYFKERYATFTTIIKTGKTKQELIEFYNKKGIDKLVDTDFMVNLVSDYENVIKECNTKEWDLEYLYYKKSDYENNYSHGTEMEQYKEIIRQITDLEN